MRKSPRDNRFRVEDGSAVRRNPSCDGGCERRHRSCMIASVEIEDPSMRIRSMKAERRRTAAKLAVPLLLVAVASVHLYFGQTGPLNPWVGGGFGMFASVDRRESRAIRASADVGSRQVALDVAGWVGTSERHARLHDRVLALPSEEALARLAAELREQRWNVEGGVFDDVDDHRALPAANSISISVWRVDYDAARSAARPAQVAAFRDSAGSR